MNATMRPVKVETPARGSPEWTVREFIRCAHAQADLAWEQVGKAATLEAIAHYEREVAKHRALAQGAEMALRILTRV